MIIDAHAHVLAPPELYAFMNRLIASRGAHGWAVPDIPDEAYEKQNRRLLGIMDRVGTDIQILSPRPFQSFHSEEPASMVFKWIGLVNDAIERICTMHPDRFRGVAGLPEAPRTTPKDWLDEARRCIEEKRFVGVLLNPDPSEGMNATPTLGEEWWYPLYEWLQANDVPALVHSTACRNGREDYSSHFITEESIAVLSLLRSRVLLDFPRLKLVISHGGGSVPYQVGRWTAESVHPLFKQNRAIDEPFYESMRRLYYDSCIYHQESIELLIRLVGSDRVLFGTEKPGSGSAPDPRTGRELDDLKPVVESISWLTDEDRARIFEKNARAVYTRIG
ncbi:MAG TPA: amidohydrolase family protein [Vicinamibacteria bacterium]|nr:amidohydrolase family protein [Vicinamibacteria bacterium]